MITEIEKLGYIVVKFSLISLRDELTIEEGPNIDLLLFFRAKYRLRDTRHVGAQVLTRSYESES